MSTAMDRHIEVVKQYPGQQQVDLAVEIEVPGSWFGAGPMGPGTEPRSLLVGAEECPSCALLSLDGRGGVREGGERQR